MLLKIKEMKLTWILEIIGLLICCEEVNFFSIMIPLIPPLGQKEANIVLHFSVFK